MVIKMKIDYYLMGKRLQERRVKANMTQEQVAEQANISTVYLSKIENGKVSPTLDTLAAICTAIDVDLGFIISGSQYDRTEYGNEDILKYFRRCAPDVKPIAITLVKNLAKLSPEKEDSWK